jgi:RHS repeat-associated protein
MTHTLSGLVAGYGYDVMDRLTNLVWRDASGSVLRGFAYSYDSAGMITQKLTTAGGNLTTETYAYDGLDRLVAVTVCSTTTLFAYDLAGNRTQMVDNGVASTYVLGQANRLASWGPAGTNCTMAFDAAGCVTSMTLEAGRRLDLEWNGRYEMTAVRTNGVVAERHGFDALGRRAWTASGGETNWYVYDGAQVVADLDATGGVVRSYVWGPGIDNLLAIVVPGGPGATPAVFHALTDHLGTVHALADETGAVVESYRYDAWGRVLGVYDAFGAPLDPRYSPLGNRYLFQGREYSWASGFYYFRARWYDPVSGRWLSPDPIGISGGLNHYVFCANNAVNLLDPHGLTIYHQTGTAAQRVRLEGFRNSTLATDAGRGVLNYLDRPEAGPVYVYDRNAMGVPGGASARNEVYVGNFLEYVHELYHQVQRVNASAAYARGATPSPDPLTLGVSVCGDDLASDARSTPLASDFEAVRVENIVNDQLWKAQGRQGARPKPRLRYGPDPVPLPYGTTYKP